MVSLNPLGSDRELMANTVCVGKPIGHLDQVPATNRYESAKDQQQGHPELDEGIWDFAGSEIPGGEPDVVMARAGDVPTIETIAGTAAGRGTARAEDQGGQRGGSHATPGGRRAPARTLKAGLRGNLHGRQADHLRLPCLCRPDPPAEVPAWHPGTAAMRGYREEGTTTTPFDMAMLNGKDRFQSAIDVRDRVPGLCGGHPDLRQSLQDRRTRARDHTRQHGEDPEEIRNWALDCPLVHARVTGVPGRQRSGHRWPDVRLRLPCGCLASLTFSPTPAAVSLTFSPASCNVAWAPRINSTLSLL